MPVLKALCAPQLVVHVFMNFTDVIMDNFGKLIFTNDQRVPSGLLGPELQCLLRVKEDDFQDAKK